MYDPARKTPGREKPQHYPILVSRLYLKKVDEPPPTILAHLQQTFTHIPAGVWTSRVDSGRVRLSDETVVTREMPYQAGQMVLYEREVPNEPPWDVEESILYQDGTILVADKPPGMPVTPGGDYMARSLLVRLRVRTGIRELTPAHRLDRDTAGVVLFVVDARLRGRYHELFADGHVNRQYRALARASGKPSPRAWRVQNRIGAGTPWFRQQILPGPPNAVTEIQLVGRSQDVGFFRVHPLTGKKHQIRVHMAAIGCPVLGDPLYPDFIGTDTRGVALQLLAHRLTFRDPVTDLVRSFESHITLPLAQTPSARV